MDSQLKQSVLMCIEHEARKSCIRLPSSVIQLCIKMFGLNSFVWHIDDLKLMKQILSARKDMFRSDLFQIAKLNWKIALYPNGGESGGVCRIVVRLLGMSFSWKSIFCQVHIECPQTQYKTVLPSLFTEDKNGPQTQYKTMCTADIISSFEDLKALCDKDLTFVIRIRIARITLKKDNKILFQMPTNEYKRKTQLQWKIDEQMMKKLKSFDKGNGICSDILNDIWCLRLYPNGSWNSKEGDVGIVLELCGLPPNVSKMSVQWTVHCHEANIKKSYTNDFDEENRDWSWGNNTISFAEFCKYNTWTMTVNINVFNEFDLNGDDDAMKQIESEWKECQQPQNDVIVPHPDWDVAFESLATNVQQIENTLRSISKAMENQNHMVKRITERVSNLEESKEHSNLEMMKQMSVLQQQVNELLSANSQSKQKVNPKHEKVRKWLKNEVDLEQYHALFIENGFEDLESIQSLNMEILNMMQIEKIGHKMKILRCVAKLKHI